MGQSDNQTSVFHMSYNWEKWKFLRNWEIFFLRLGFSIRSKWRREKISKNSNLSRTKHDLIQWHSSSISSYSALLNYYKFVKFWKLKKKKWFLKHSSREKNFCQNLEDFDLKKYDWEKYAGWSNIKLVSLSLWYAPQFANLKI